MCDCARVWVFSLGLLLTVGLIACSKPEQVDELRRGRLRCTEMVERKRVNNYCWETFIEGSGKSAVR